MAARGRGGGGRGAARVLEGKGKFLMRERLALYCIVLDTNYDSILTAFA